MIADDYLFGSFEFDTNISQDEKGDYVAEALGYSAKHASRDQAINDLNQIISQEMEKGNIVPTMGG